MGNRNVFNVLKNACRVEALQLSQMERVEKALALYMVVSWRIARLIRVGRTCPELDASLFFAADENAPYVDVVVAFKIKNEVGIT